MKTRLKMYRLTRLLLVAALTTTLPTMSHAQCFGGTSTMEKTVGVDFVGPSSNMLSREESSVTNDCIAFCKGSNACPAFKLNYMTGTCASYNSNNPSVVPRENLIPAHGTNFFEKICFRGVDNYQQVCGSERLWAFERVLDAFLDGIDNKTIPNVNDRYACMKHCLDEDDFVCRSADYDTVRRSCRLSREDRRTRPAQFVSAPGSSIDYLENQCVLPLPDCRYNIQRDVMVISMDALEFANTQEDCESLCDKTRFMTCRSYTFDFSVKRCYLSGDDSISLNKTVLPIKNGVVTGEKQCTVSQCERDQGTIIYEKITGKTVRTARETIYNLNDVPGGISEACAKKCMDDSGECPAFAVDYVNNRCYRLDRNTQGRSSDIVDSKGKSYFEKICVRASLPSICQDNVWQFERVPGMELRGLDDRTLNLVSGRRDCIEACLAENAFLCRSAEYDSVALTCRLSRYDRRTNPNDYVPASNDIEYLESQCIPVDLSCPYEMKESAYPLYLDDTVDQVTSEERCKQVCTDYQKFTCRSLAYRPTGSQCFISGDDRASAGANDAFQSRPGTIYYERNCLRGGGTTPTRPTTRPTDPGTFPGTGTGTGTGTTRPGTGTPGTGGPDGENNLFAVNRCQLGRLTYEKVTGYELSRVVSDLLYSNDIPGITKECARRCANTDSCMSFNIDYNRKECYSLETRSFEAPDNLRSSSGSGYFEGICLRSGGCGLLWTYERVPNFELRGQERETFSRITKSECMERCLAERRFVCRSANYEYSRQICRISDQNRFSAPSSFQAAPNVDYMENQCAERARDCSYTNQQRDRYLIYTTKTTDAFSDAACERACDIESEFNCRAYSFMSQANLDGDQCFLSGDTGQYSGNHAFQLESGAMFAEKRCTDFTTSGGGGTTTGPPTGVENCRFSPTYDKIMGVDLRSGRDEIRARDQLGITIDCLKECDRQGSRCKAVTLETSPSTAQRCYALDRGAGNDVNAFVEAQQVSYFEKVCIPERGCGKAWSFVRVPGYDLTATGRVVPNIATREQCQAQCLRSTDIPCRSAVYNARQRSCKLMAETRRTDPDKFEFRSRDIEFMENQCAPDPPNCDYANYEGRFLPYFDRFFTNVFDPDECRQYCSNERDFTCRSFNFQSFRRECSLSSDDTYTVGGQNSLQVERDYFYSEKAACKTVKVDCTPTDMLVTFTFGTAFEGRIYATGNPQACFEMGNRQTQVVLRVPLGTTCGTKEEADGRFVNTVVVQQHPLIMQEADRTVRVECSFEAGDQTVSYAPSASPGRTGGGIDINTQFRPVGASDVISNTAPTPTVRMRIYQSDGKEANNVDLGEVLTLKIEMEQSSAFAIFARNLEARTDNGELMTLIDNIGCPRYPGIFPELELEERSKVLYADFKAFRFPSTARVNFVATIRFCQDRCEPVSCGGGVVSFGRRRRRRGVNETHIEGPDAFPIDDDDDPDNEYDSPVGDYSETTVLLSANLDEGVTTRTTARIVRSTDTSSTTTSTTSTATTTSTTSTTSTTMSSANVALTTRPMNPKENDTLSETPNDIPVALSLVVGEDTMPEGWDDRHRYRYRDDTYVADDYVCTPTSTVIAAVLTLLVLLCAAVAGFVFFYRSKKRHWQKMGNCDPFPIPPPPKSQFYNGPEVMFRAAYGGYPGQSPLASNMAAFASAQGLPPMQEESPQYKE